MSFKNWIDNHSYYFFVQDEELEGDVDDSVRKEAETRIAEADYKLKSICRAWPNGWRKHAENEYVSDDLECTLIVGEQSIKLFYLSKSRQVCCKEEPIFIGVYSTVERIRKRFEKETNKYE
jgi:hypothetical protein